MIFNKLRHSIISELILQVGNLFPVLDEHDIDHEVLSEDLHSLQLVKIIIKKYLTMRLLRYGQQFTQNVLQKGKLGLRQQLVYRSMPSYHELKRTLLNQY